MNAVAERDVTTHVKGVLEFAESATSEDRYIEEMKVGQYVRQGDLYIQMVASADPAWKPTKNRQLALGATQGSRHTVADSITVMANPKNGEVEILAEGKFRCLGPQIVAETRFSVDHPEHGNMSLPPGCYQVGFQVDGRTQSRVRD